MRTRSLAMARKTATWLALIVVALALAWMIPGLLSETALWLDDFIQYWAAGHLNVRGFNPYDSVQMGTVQQSLGRSDTLMMFLPPHALAVMMPLALMPHTTARLVWFLLNLAAVGLSTWWLCSIYDAPWTKRWLALLLALLFPPTVSALGFGQITPLILLGLAGFLRYEKADRPWLAGVFLALVFLKPQWMYLLWPALLAWSITTRRVQELVAASLAIFIGTMIAVAFNPTVVGQYVQLFEAGGPARYLPPTIGGLLRVIFGAERYWLQFLPMSVGLGWLTVYWLRNKAVWSWQEHLPALVLVSALTSSYGWTFDQVVLLVALFPAITSLFSLRGNRILPWLVAGGIILYGSGLLWADLTAWWHAPAWGLWYWAVKRSYRIFSQTHGSAFART